MNFAKKIFTGLLCGMIAVSAFTFVPPLSQNADAASFSQVNASSVFVKQQTSYTCTLASNVMLLRRTALMRGDSDWASITESACRPKIWDEDNGMLHYYSYKDIDVSYRYISGSVTSELINALKEHPEGIVVYDRNYPHAILLTDYTDGVFYCADPANNVPSGRINVSKSLISISNVSTYWYVKSPDVSFNNDGKTDPGIENINQKWKINSSNGVNMRSYAGTSYSVVGGVPYNKTVTVTKKVKSDGYTWGYTSYNGVKGWIALDFATLVSSNTNALTNKSTVSSTTIVHGSTVTLKGAASGGTAPYQYIYYYKKTKDKSWTLAKNYSSSTSVSIKPAYATTYDICIKVKDKTGKIEKKYFTLNVTASLKNNSSISKTTITHGNTVTLKGAASGGTAPYQYIYYYKKTKDKSWTLAKNYSSSTSVSIKPAYATTYDICIKVKDKTGKIEKKYFTLNVK